MLDSPSSSILAKRKDSGEPDRLARHTELAIVITIIIIIIVITRIAADTNYEPLKSRLSLVSEGDLSSLPPQRASTPRPRPRSRPRPRPRSRLRRRRRLHC